MLTELNYLYVWGNNNLGSIDVSHNSKLLSLDVEDCGLSALDLSHNPDLNYLYCVGNLLTELDLSNNPLMATLYCYNNSNLATLYLLEGQTINYYRKDDHTQIVYVAPGV